MTEENEWLKKTARYGMSGEIILEIFELFTCNCPISDNK